MTFWKFWQKTTTRQLGQVTSPQDSQDLGRALAAASDESHALQEEMDNVRQLVVQTGDEGRRKLAELQHHVVQENDEGARKLAELQHHVVQENDEGARKLAELQHHVVQENDEGARKLAELQQHVVQENDEGRRKLNELQQHVVQENDEARRKLNELQQNVEHAVAEQERVQHQIQALQGELQDAKARQDNAESRAGKLELEFRQEHIMQLGLIQQIEGRERALELRTDRAVWVASAALLLVAICTAAMVWSVYNNNRVLGDLGGDLQDIKLSMTQPPALNLTAPPVEEYDTLPAAIAQPLEMIPETYQSQAEPDEVIDLLPVPSVIGSAGSVNQVRKYVKREDTQLFFDDNALQPGVISRPSGLQYKIISQGSGRMPSMSDRVQVNYRTFLLDGTEIDSSYQKPGDSIFALGEVLPVMKEALLLMEEGTQLELYVPPNLASKAGTRKRWGNHRFEPRVYVLELKSIVDVDESGQDQ